MTSKASARAAHWGIRLASLVIVLGSFGFSQPDVEACNNVYCEMGAEVCADDEHHATILFFGTRNGGFPDMDTFVQQLINGLTIGSIYALIALGYTMVYGILRLINFAHGDIYMVGAYAGFILATALGFASDPSAFGFVVTLVGAARFRRGAGSGSGTGGVTASAVTRSLAIST